MSLLRIITIIMYCYVFETGQLADGVTVPSQVIGPGRVRGLGLGLRLVESNLFHFQRSVTVGWRRSMTGHCDIARQVSPGRHCDGDDRDGCASGAGSSPPGSVTDHASDCGSGCSAVPGEKLSPTAAATDMMSISVTDSAWEI